MVRDDFADFGKMVEKTVRHKRCTIFIMYDFVIIKVGNKMSCTLQEGSSSDTAGMEVFIAGRKNASSHHSRASTRREIQ